MVENMGSELIYFILCPGCLFVFSLSKQYFLNKTNKSIGSLRKTLKQIASNLVNYDIQIIY